VLVKYVAMIELRPRIFKHLNTQSTFTFRWFFSSCNVFPWIWATVGHRATVAHHSRNHVWWILYVWNMCLLSVICCSKVVPDSSNLYTGVALRPCTSFGLPVAQRRFLLKVRAGRPCLGCTKRSRSRKSRARVSGFRARLQTPTGRRVLKRRRVKGRKILVPAANPNSGKLA